MHRWFFADDAVAIKEPTPPPTPPEYVKTSSLTSLPDSCWKFCVKYDRELCSNESMAVCGSTSILGQWDPNKCLLLAKENNSKRWSLLVLLPRKYDIRYRYLICIVTASGKKILRFWEHHQETRLIGRHQTQSSDNEIYETFGYFNDKLKVGRGWIDSYITVVQFKFYEAPFTLQKNEDQTQLYVKVSPLKLKSQEKCGKIINDDTSSIVSLQLPQKSAIETDLKSPFAFSEVALLQNQNGEFHKQPKYGTSCGANDILIFNITLSNFQETAYVIDLYKYSPKAGPDVPPRHIGYQHVLPQELKGSDGTLRLTIMCGIRHRPIGSMICDYLVVKPLYSYDFNMEKNFPYLNNKQMGLHIGHRGSGKSYWYKNDILRENTTDSFKRAFQHGADMVEFDVQLTKDGVPVLYHDFKLYISNNCNIDTQEYDVMHLPLTPSEITSLKPYCRNTEGGLISIPLNRFTVDQLKRVKVYEPPKDSKVNPCPVNDKNNRPFPTLQKVLNEMEAKLGFFIEIKWPQKFKNGSTQENFIQNFDRNKFVDIILDNVLKTKGSRNIIFLSYDADICTMIRLKQNRYPVVYMIHDISTDVTKVYSDPRGKSIDCGIYFAKAMELYGVSANCDNIFSMPGKVSDTHERDLALFIWGERLRIEESRRFLKNLGVDGIVCDRVSFVLEPGDLKRNIFLIDLMDELVETNENVCNPDGIA